MKDILKTVFDYLKENHPDAIVSQIDESCFQVNSDGKKVLGYRRSVYSGGGWSISIGRPVTPEIVYNIQAVYNNGEITWAARIVNGKVEEQSYENILSG